MAHVEKTIVIDAPIEQVFRYATNLTKGPEWWPSLVENRNFPQEQMVKGLKYEWTYKMLGVKIDGAAEVLDLVPNERVRFKTEGGIPSTFDYRYSREGGKTRVSMTVDYTVPGKVLGRIADKLFVERANEREAEHAFNNLKEICEATAAATRAQS